jgi:hypothetical protein
MAHPSLADTLMALQRLEGDGNGTYIIRAGRYLSGIPCLWSACAARAYLFPSRIHAETVIRCYPSELQGAQVRQLYP